MLCLSRVVQKAWRRMEQAAEAAAKDVSGGPDNEDSTTSEARRQGGVGTRGRLRELRPELAHTTASELANGPQMMAPRKSSGRRSQRFVMDLR